MNNFNIDDNQNKKEPIKINNIEELLLNEEKITEIIYTYDQRYKECFNEANILKLIDYSTHMPYISDDEIITHKYPFMPVNYLNVMLLISMKISSIMSALFLIFLNF